MQLLLEKLQLLLLHLQWLLIHNSKVSLLLFDYDINNTYIINQYLH
jgi:hypothetical protein